MRPQQGYGPVQGYALLRYEDAAGIRYTQQIPLATVIEEKVPVLAPATAQEEDERKALPVWIPVAGTLFAVGLLAAGLHRIRWAPQAGGLRKTVICSTKKDRWIHPAIFFLFAYASGSRLLPVISSGLAMPIIASSVGATSHKRPPS